ncbi:retrovirus-related pol polyprotein from transposon TNT 1-94 [Tanacetum coccineum]
MLTDQRLPLEGSGCSRHMTGVKSYLHKYVEQSGPKVVFGDDSTCTTEGYGSIKCNGIVFTKVAFVNGLKYNLISISQLCDAKYIVQFDEKRGTIFNSNKEVVMIAPRDKPCLSREKGKHHRANFKTKQTSFIKKCLHLLHMDLFGPVNPRSINHEKYTLVIVDGYSRVFNTRIHQTEETYHITFDESPDAIKFSKPSVDNINIAETERYPPDEYLHPYKPSQRYQTNNNDVSFIKPYEYPKPVVLETKVSSDQNGQIDQNDHNDQNDQSVQNDEILNDDHSEHSNHTNDEQIIDNLPNTEDIQISEHLSSPSIVGSAVQTYNFTSNSTLTHSINGAGMLTRAMAKQLIARLEAIKIFLAFATYMNFIVYQMVIKSAFLNGKLKEEVYVKQPPGFESNEFPNHVYKLDKALYGLKQAPRACMMGVLTYFLGFQIKQSKRGISINQEKYVKDLLKKYDINGSLVKTLMVPFNNLGPDLSGKAVNKTRYRGLTLKGYSDSDYAGCNMDRKSTSGACQLLRGKLVCWSAKKQQSVAFQLLK